MPHVMGSPVFTDAQFQWLSTSPITYMEYEVTSSSVAMPSPSFR